MSAIQRIASDSQWESVFGYSHSVRAGEWLLVSGTAATDARGTVAGTGQMYVQARQALLNLKAQLERAGLGLESVVRTRVSVTDLSRFAEVARAHKEILGEVMPALTVVEVCRLVHPDMLIEIEADAYAGQSPSAGEQHSASVESAAASAPQTPASRVSASKAAAKLAPAKRVKSRRATSAKPPRVKPGKRK